MRRRKSIAVLVLISFTLGVAPRLAPLAFAGPVTAPPTGDAATGCNGEQVGAPPPHASGDCATCQPVLTISPESPPTIPPPPADLTIAPEPQQQRPHRELTYPDPEDSMNVAAPTGGNGTLNPETGALFVSRLETGLSLMRCREPYNACEHTYCPPAPGGGGGGKKGAAEELDLKSGRAVPVALSYDSHTNLNRMTGNWWFPFDVFLVPQPNGDIRYYGPGSVGALYTWVSSSQTFVSPPGAFDLLTANPNGTWTRTSKHGTMWGFDSAGGLVWVQDRYGNATTITRDNQGRITAVADFAGRTTTLTYGTNGYLAAMTDWGGRTTSFAYTLQGYLSQITLPATTFFDTPVQQVVTRSKTISFQYTSGTGTSLDGNLLAIVDDAGNAAMSVTYDGFDRAVGTTSRGRPWTYSYLPDGSTQVVDPDGMTVKYSFNSQGAIVRKEVFTRSGLGLPALRNGEPNSYVWRYERNSGCQCELITRVIRPDATGITFTYDGLGNVLSRTRHPAPGSGAPALCETWTWASFAQFSTMLAHTSARGNLPGAPTSDFTSTLAYDTFGSLSSITAPKAVVSGTLQHPQMSFTHNTRGLLVSATRVGGEVTHFDYEPTTWNISKIVYDYGVTNATWEFTYDVFGRVLTTSNPRGYVSTREYNALNQVTRAYGPQPLAPVCTWLFDENERLYRSEVENKDSTGVVDVTNPVYSTYRTYDVGGRLATITGEVDVTHTASSTLSYTIGGRLSRIMDANGVQQDFTYDERGLLFTRNEGVGSTIGSVRYDYTPVGAVGAVHDQRGFITQYESDHSDRLAKTTFPDGLVERLTWDADGHLLTSQRETSQGVALERSQFSFDPCGLLVSRSRDLINAAGQTQQSLTETCAYNASLLVASTADAAGGTTSYTYGRLGRVSEITNPVGDRILWTYDARGNVATFVRKNWNASLSQYDVVTTTLVHDALDRAASRTEVGGTLTRTDSLSFDGLGRVVASSDRLGNTERTNYDGYGRAVTVTRDLRVGGTGAGAVVGTIQTVSGHDLGGRLTWIDDPNTGRTSFSYDNRNRIASITRPSSQVEARSYDAASNLIQVTDAVGNQWTATYDSRGRRVARAITRATGTLGTTSESFQYDALGRLTTAVDDDSTVVFAYDSMGRIVSETQGPNPLGASPWAFTFGYNATDDISQVTYPDGTVESKSRDSGRRLGSTSIAGVGTIASYQYSGAQVLASSLSLGVSRTVTRDALQRALHIAYQGGGGPLRHFEYARNAADQLLLEKRHHAGGSGDNYSYDSTYRFVQAKVGVADPVAELQTPGSQSVTSVVSLAYDAGGNRTNVTTTGANAGSVTYTADALNFYTAIGTRVQARDGNGNLKDDGTFIFSYDYRDQLVEVRLKSSGALVASYEYDFLGRRVSKSTSSGTRQFVWRGARLAMEYDGAGLLCRRHVGAGGEVVLAVARDVADLNANGSTVDMVHLVPLYDALRDCTAIVGPSGAIVEAYGYTYDGAVTITNGAGQGITTSAIAWSEGYESMYRDVETGLLYGLNRYYSPTDGRFLTTDPGGDWYDTVGLGNGYAFTGNSYRTAIDPLGLDTVIDHTPGHMSPTPEQAASIKALKDEIQKIQDGSCIELTYTENATAGQFDKGLEECTYVVLVAHMNYDKQAKKITSLGLKNDEDPNGFPEADKIKAEKVTFVGCQGTGVRTGFNSAIGKVKGVSVPRDAQGQTGPFWHPDGCCWRSDMADWLQKYLTWVKVVVQGELKKKRETPCGPIKKICVFVGSNPAPPQGGAK